MLPLLQVQDLSLSFEGQLLFEKVDFSLAAGELLLLHGPSGSGKSSLLQAIMGMGNTRNLKGRIVLHGSDITPLSVEKHSQAGIAFIPEKRPIFPELSVGEHLKLSAKGKIDDSLLPDFPVLQSRQKQLAGTLSGGEQAVLSCVMVQQQNPSVILWDMPLKGLSSDWVRKIFRIIRLFKNKGIPMLMAVQNPADWQAFEPKLWQLGNP
ncbi:MAG: ATP-binding cassette domain-containing protein [Bacteroidia bacterium]